MTVLEYNPFYGQSLIDIKQLDAEAIDLVIALAQAFKQHGCPPLLNTKILASCFFEPSTRTRLSFESAMCRLGGQVIGFAHEATTSATKGETLSDSMRVMSAYADAIILRHHEAGAAKDAAESASIPVINAGDGAEQHPSQTLVDLFSMNETQGTLKGLAIALVGDLKYGRTIHSLLDVAHRFDFKLYLVSSSALALPEKYCLRLDQHGVSYEQHDSVASIIDKVDILYMTREQKERFQSPDTNAEYDALTPTILKQARPTLKILHPLPRQAELPTSIDALPCAYYFQQAANGLYVREALLALTLSDFDLVKPYLGDVKST